MRGPIAAGVLAGVLVVLVGLSAFVALALSRPGPAMPTPPPTVTGGSPTVPGSTATLAPPSSTPTAAASTPVPTSGPSPALTERVGLDVGDRAPGLNLLAVGGAEVDTSLLLGRPLWVNFMATWCPPCVDELPVMQRMQLQLEEQMTILVIDVGEPEEAVAAFVDSLGVDLPVGLDEDGAAQRTWGAWALPVHYWIDAEGRIGASLWGGAGPEQFIDGIHSVLPDVELEP